MDLLPLFPLDVVLLPGVPLPLHIFEQRYKEMIGEVLSSKQDFGVIRGKDDTIAEMGCTAQILEVTKRYDDGRLDIVTAGRRRFEVIQLNQERTYLQAEVKYFDDEAGSAVPSDVKKVLDLHQELLKLAGAEAEVPEEDEPQLSFHLAGVLPLDLDLKQNLLGMRSEPQRMAALLEYYSALVPQVKRTIKVREKSRGNGHAM